MGGADMTAPAKAPTFDDEVLDAARAAFTHSGNPDDARRYAGQLRTKAAAHRSYADRLDGHADAIDRWANREGGTP